MKRIAQALQFAVIVKSGRPLAPEAQRPEKRDFFRGGIALQGRILKERPEAGLFVSRRRRWSLDELESFRVPGR